MKTVTLIDLCVYTSTCCSQRNFCGCLSYCVGPWDWTQSFRLRGQTPFWLNHFTNPEKWKNFDFSWVIYFGSAYNLFAFFLQSPSFCGTLIYLDLKNESLKRWQCLQFTQDHSAAVHCFSSDILLSLKSMAEKKKKKKEETQNLYQQRNLYFLLSGELTAFSTLYPSPHTLLSCLAMRFMLNAKSWTLRQMKSHRAKIIQLTFLLVDFLKNLVLACWK